MAPVAKTLAPNPQTLVIKLKHPYYNLLNVVQTGYWAIVNTKTRNKVGAAEYGSLLGDEQVTTAWRNSLLWVYEGLTEYLGEVLMVRSGLVTPDEYRLTMTNQIRNLAVIGHGHAGKTQLVSSLLHLSGATPRCWTSTTSRSGAR